MSAARFLPAGLCAGLLLALPAAAQRLNDTGQITCYDATASTGTVSPSTPDPETAGFNEQDCTRGAAAADALGRMVKIGGSTVPGRDYTKIANDGSVLPASAAFGTGPGDWGCTRDNVTGLIWELRPLLPVGLRFRGYGYTWYDANAAINGGNAGTIGTNVFCGGTLPNCNTTAYRNAINALTGSDRLCGATDWRLPTVGELSGLIHNQSAPAMDVTWFPDFTGQYWTGQNYASDAGRAWVVNFNVVLTSAFPKNGELGLRLVRGGR
jgi:hypothetical protein